jgi:hypothetical protein
MGEKATILTTLNLRLPGLQRSGSPPPLLLPADADALLLLQQNAPTRRYDRHIEHMRIRASGLLLTSASEGVY